MFICNLGSNNVIVSPFKTEGGSAMSQSVKVSRQLSAQFLVPLGLTEDGSSLAGLKRFGGSWAFPLARPALSPRALPHSFHSGTHPKRRGLTASVPALPFSTAPETHLHSAFLFCRTWVTAMSQQQGKQENRMRWDVRELLRPVVRWPASAWGLGVTGKPGTQKCATDGVVHSGVAEQHPKEVALDTGKYYEEKKLHGRVATALREQSSARRSCLYQEHKDSMKKGLTWVKHKSVGC